MEACPTGALVFGKRKDLVKIAWDRITAHPERYQNHVYGEHEMGGTAWMTISGAEFKEVGLNEDLGTKAAGEYTAGALGAVPMVVGIWPVLLGGAYAITKRKEQIAKEEQNDAVNAAVARTEEEAAKKLQASLDAAICAALNLTGLAGGAAVAGCCAQMVGFAVMSFKENKWSGLISQGLGTSMLQMGNIVKNPRIWIPPTLAAAITGPIATCLFRLQMNGPAVSSGMGTCGLVGQIGVYTGWLEEIAAGSRSQITAFDWIGMILICFVLPAVLSLVFGQILRKIGWIKEDDLKL